MRVYIDKYGSTQTEIRIPIRIRGLEFLGPSKRELASAAESADSLTGHTTYAQFARENVATRMPEKDIYKYCTFAYLVLCGI